MRGGDQRFGGGTLLVFEPGSKGIRGFGEHAGVSGKISVAGAAGPAPHRFRFADHVTCPCCCVLVAIVQLQSQKVVWWVEVAARAVLAPQVCWRFKSICGAI